MAGGPRLSGACLPSRLARYLAGDVSVSTLTPLSEWTFSLNLPSKDWSLMWSIGSAVRLLCGCDKSSHRNILWRPHPIGRNRAESTDWNLAPILPADFQRARLEKVTRKWERLSVLRRPKRFDAYFGLRDQTRINNEPRLPV